MRPPGRSCHPVAFTAGAWPQFRPARTLLGAIPPAIFALMANLCGCTASTCMRSAEPHTVVARRMWPPLSAIGPV